MGYKNKEDALNYNRTYRVAHKASYDAYHAKYRKDNDLKIKKENHKNKIKWLMDWEGIIPVQTQCQVCGKDIFFNRGNKVNGIYFDHRNGGIEQIKGSPNNWLRSHPRNPVNEAIWKSCDFGYLCLCCNRSLPTVNRKLYVDNVFNYFYKK
jgi:hypothetical protein